MEGTNPEWTNAITTQYPTQFWAHQTGIGNLTTQAVPNSTTDPWCQHFKDSYFIHSPTRYTTATRALVAFAFILIMVINILGNSVVIVAVIADRPLRRLTSSLIVSLAVSDILVALSAEIHSIVLIINDHHLQVSRIMCEVSTSADLYFSLCELMHLACLATERFLAICHPFHYERISRVFLVSIILLAWTVPLAFSFLPILLFQHTVGQSNLYNCLKSLNISVCVFLPNQFFSTLLFAVMFLLPSGVMFYCYARICFVAYSQSKRLNSILLGTFTRDLGSSYEEITNGDPKEHMSMTFTYPRNASEPNVEERDDDDETKFMYASGNGADVSLASVSHAAVKIRDDIEERDAAQTPTATTTTPTTHNCARNATKIAPFNNNSPKSQHRTEDFKAAKSIGLLCLFFLITWGPYWLAVLLLPFLNYRNIADIIVGSALWLNFLGTALNPFIYYFSNTAVKEGIIRVFRKFLSHAHKLVLSFVSRTRRQNSGELNFHI